jgi:mRNA (2'-O-methyladenosine-N6-)-methyltransferase
MESSLTLANLHDLLSPTAKPQNTLDYSNLKDIFNYETTCHTLSKFKNAHTTPMVPFIETCDDQTHAEILAKQQHQQHVRVPKDLQNCLRLKIHYIPMIKQHTDASLGDCSYLDTCHKLDSCRYVHYLKHIPRQQAQVEISKADEFNSKIPYFEKVSGWSRNGCVSNISRTVLESQWINCDVRKFNFNILGKFAAVIADRK